MSKIKTSVTIDLDVYLQAKARKINISEILNEVLKNSTLKLEENADIIKLEQELRNKQEEKKEIDIQITTLTASLLLLKTEGEKEEKEQIDKLIALDNSIKASGMQWKGTD